MAINTTLIIVFGAVCYFVLPFLIWFCCKGEKLKNILTIVFFCLYLIILFCGVFGRIGISEKNITIDFIFDQKWCDKSINTSLALDKITKFDLVINLVMLLPVGMITLYFSKKMKWWRKIILLFIVGICSGGMIELLQFILPIQRSVQFTDILLNMISVIVGGMIAWLYLLLINKIRKIKE